MTPRSALAAPMATFSNTHRRRRSADDRFGSAASRPISISSGEEEEEDVPVARRKPKIPTSQSDAVIPRPSSARPLRLQQPTTPDRARRPAIREVATDPGGHQSTTLSAFNDTPIAKRQIYRPYCGKKNYVYQGRMHTHQKTCPDCQRIQNQTQEENIGKDEEGKEEKLTGRTPPERSASIAHGSDDAGDKINDDDSDVGNKHKGKEKKRERSAQLMHNVLIEKARKRLTQGEEEGKIYIFRHTNGIHKGLLKIGTTKSVKQRAAQHKKCEPDMEWIYFSERVKAMKRAERLTKVDLEHLCSPWSCSQCHEQHTEWFKIDEQKAKNVVDRWVNWINEQDPYNEDGYLKPIWGYLMDHGRLPRPAIEHHDHEARWVHWTWLLSAPLPSDIECFAKYNDRGKTKDKNEEAVPPQQRNNDEIIALPHRQHTSELQVALTAPLKELMQIATMLDKEKSINITLNVNMGCDFRGRASISQVPPQG